MDTMAALINPNPVVIKPEKDRRVFVPTDNDGIQEFEVFDIIRDIRDPEHPHTLEELQVVKEELVEINASDGDATQICVSFNPTVPHCSLATLIGLCMRVKLQRELPSQCKCDMALSHNRRAVNKQVNDKERVCAALENPTLLRMVEDCIRPPE